MKIREITLCMISLLIWNCSEKKLASLTKEIQVSLDSCMNLNMEQGQIIALETTDSSLLYDIVSVDKVENKYFIRSRNNILTFDAEGNYLYNISRKGQGDKEYLNLTSFFIKDKELYLYDFGTSRMLIFGLAGNYLRTEKVPIEDNHRCVPYLIYPIGENQYIAKNQFNGTPDIITPALSLLNNKYAISQKVEGRSLKSGFTLFDFMYFNNRNGVITYWEALNDTIYTLENNMIYPEYIVSFGKHSIPQTVRVNKDIYDLIDFVNKPENKEYATFVRYVSAEDKYMYFVFLCGDSTYLAKYSKQAKKTIIYTLPQKYKQKYRLAPFLRVEGDTLTMVLEDIQDIENNQSLFRINKNSLHANY